MNFPIENSYMKFYEQIYFRNRNDKECLCISQSQLLNESMLLIVNNNSINIYFFIPVKPLKKPSTNNIIRNFNNS